MAGLKSMVSCRENFSKLRILTIVALNIKEVILYVDGEDLQRTNTNTSIM